jgi:hypothetical protein
MSGQGVQTNRPRNALQGKYNASGAFTHTSDNDDEIRRAF